MSRTVLMLTYEFPPTGGAGVQRVAKFARYLPEDGWQATVVTSEHAWGRPRDDSLLADVADVAVVRIPSRNLASGIARAIAPLKRALKPGRAGSGNGSRSAASSAEGRADGSRGGHVPLSARVAKWLAVPDYAAYWVHPAVREAVRVGRERGAEVVFASGPPFSVLVAGLEASRRLGIPFVADLRDVWRGNPNNSGPTFWHDGRSLALERSIAEGAAAITVAAEPVAEELTALGARDVHVVHNGFDASEMPEWRPDPDAGLTVAYMGRFYAGTHDPSGFLRALADAVADDPAGRPTRLELIGEVSPHVLAAIRSSGLGEHVAAHGYLPHGEALERVSRADVGLVVLNEDDTSRSMYPAKLFEYLGIGLPVLAVGPLDGVTARLVREACAGLAVADERAAVAGAIRELAAAKAAGTSGPRPRADVIGAFERSRQAADLAAILDGAAGGVSA